MKRLVRKKEAFNDYNNSTIFPYGIVFRDIDTKIVNKDDINNITYGPSYNSEWLFDKPLDNPERYLQQNL